MAKQFETPTAAEDTIDKSWAIVRDAVQGCDNAVGRLKDLMQDRGGRAAYLAELGAQAQPLRDAAADLRGIVTQFTDWPANDIEA